MMWKVTTAFISYSTSINNCVVTHYRLDVPGIDTGGGQDFSNPFRLALGYQIIPRGKTAEA